MPSSVRLRSIVRDFDAIQWRVDNEAQIRQFVGNDEDIHFDGAMLQIWKSRSSSWINVPVWNWIYRDAMGELNTITNQQKIHLYEEISAPTVNQAQSQASSPEADDLDKTEH